MPRSCSRGGVGVITLAVLAAGLACDDDTPAPDLQARYFDTRPYGVPDCDRRTGALAGRRELVLFQGAAAGLLGAPPVEPVTRALQRYYDRHGLAFHTAAAARPVATRYALDTDLDKLERELGAAFPGVDLENPPPERRREIERYVLNFILGPMRAFAREHGGAGTGRTNLVVLAQLVPPGADGLIGEGQLAGLAISPALLARFARGDVGAEAALWEEADLPADFTPMLFVGGELLGQLARRDPVARELVVAHEFGHTAALVHVMVANNLMYPSIGPSGFTCADFLDAEQLDVMRATLGVGTPPRSLAPVERARIDVTATRDRGLSTAHAGPSPRVKALLRREPGSLAPFLRPLLHRH